MIARVCRAAEASPRRCPGARGLCAWSLVVFAFLMVGCGSAPTAAPVSSALTAPASAAPSVSATLPATAGQPGPAFDACVLITPEDAAVVLGAPAQQQRPISNLPGFRCVYYIPPPPINRFLTLVACNCGRTDAQFDAYAAERARISNVGLTPIVGVGDRAFLLKLGLGLVFRKGGVDIELSLQDPPDFMSPTAPTNRLADTVVEQKAAALYPNVARIVLRRLAGVSLPAPSASPTAPPVPPAGAPASGLCAAPPVVTPPVGFTFTGCRDQGPVAALTWAGPSGAILMLSVTSAALPQFPNPSSAPVDINGRAGTIGARGPDAWVVVWSDGKSNFALNGSKVAKDVALAFARSVR